MSILSDTYRRKPQPATPAYSAPALATWLLLGVSVVAALQSVYFDVRAQNNRTASAQLYGAWDMLVERQKKQIADFDYAIAKLNELRKEKQDARH